MGPNTSLTLCLLPSILLRKLKKTFFNCIGYIYMLGNISQVFTHFTLDQPKHKAVGYQWKGHWMSSTAPISFIISYPFADIYRAACHQQLFQALTTQQIHLKTLQSRSHLASWKLIYQYRVLLTEFPNVKTFAMYHREKGKLHRQNPHYNNAKYWPASYIL